jgi:D-3-phosphoglycerate dehydrogenase
VGRKEEGGQAVMLLSFDKAIPTDILDRIKSLPDIDQVRSIEL